MVRIKIYTNDGWEEVDLDCTCTECGASMNDFVRSPHEDTSVQIAPCECQMNLIARLERKLSHLERKLYLIFQATGLMTKITELNKENFSLQQQRDDLIKQLEDTQHARTT